MTCLTVAFYLLIALPIFLTWPHLTIICPPTLKKNYLAENQYRSNDDTMSAVDDCFDLQDESLFTNGIQIPMEELCEPQGVIC